MKGIKTILGIALATTGFGGAIAVGAVSATQNNKVEVVEAATTNFNDSAVYLDTSSCWKSGKNDERFAIYWSTGSETGWYSMIEISNNFYGGRLPEKNINLIILCRMNKSTPDNNWGNKWNQTADLTTFTKTSAVFKVSTWDNAGSTDWKANSGYTSKFSNRYVACADNGWKENDADYKMSLDMTKAEARLEKEFTVSGSETVESLKVTDGTWTNSYGCSHVVSTVDSNYVDLSEGSNNNIGLKVSGTYELYWKYLATDGKEIWIQIGSDTEATNYAQTFLNSATCTDSSTTFNLNVWNKVGEATTSLEYKYSQLTTGAKNLLKNAEANKDSSSKIEQCAARYDRILGKYGYGTGNDKYHDFMERTPAPISGSRNILNSHVNSNVPVIVSIVSVVCLTSVGLYFLLKKKKFN